MLISENQIELQSIDWFKELGYNYKNGKNISPDSDFSERESFKTTILTERLLSSIKKLNNDISNKVIDNSINNKFMHLSIASYEILRIRICY